MGKICGIYKITSPTGKIYIGQSVHIMQRISKYKTCACYHQIKLYSSIKKYGWEAHKFEIIHECTREELNDLEVYYIALFQCFDTKQGLNLKSGGGVQKQAIESIKKRIESRKGYKHSEVTKQKLSLIHLGKKGHPMSEQAKQKLSLRHKGKKLSEEHRLNLSIAKKGIKFTDEHIQKLISAQLGKKQSQETKDKKSSVVSGRKYPNSSSKYIGVGRTNRSGMIKWNCGCVKNKIRYHIGTFPYTPCGEILAALAYDKFMEERFGETVKLNFPRPKLIAA